MIISPGEGTPYVIERTLSLFIVMLLGGLLIFIVPPIVRLIFYKSDISKLIIDDSGVFINEFGKKRKFDWSKIEKIRIKGFPIKYIRFNKKKWGKINGLKYYLFSPDQRKEIVEVLEIEIGKRIGVFQK